MTSEDGEESINALAHEYTGKPYAWYSGRTQSRLVVTIEADHITSVPQAADSCRHAAQTGHSARDRTTSCAGLST